MSIEVVPNQRIDHLVAGFGGEQLRRTDYRGIVWFGGRQAAQTGGTMMMRSQAAAMLSQASDQGARVCVIDSGANALSYYTTAVHRVFSVDELSECDVVAAIVPWSHDELRKASSSMSICSLEMNSVREGFVEYLNPAFAPERACKSGV